jgi:F0F1-type ATP synthase delta subunit
MKPIINLSPLKNHLQTKYNITEVISSLDKILSELFKKQRTTSDILDKSAPFPLSDDLRKLAKEHDANIEDQIQADKFFGDVREAIMNLPILTITTGISPTLEFIREINGWVIANINGFIAIDFVVDRSLIAGAIINFNGKSRDYSVKKQTMTTATVQNMDMNVQN